MDPNSWLNASDGRPHLLPRVEQSYIYEPQIPGPSTAPRQAWMAGDLGEARPSVVRVPPPSDFSMSMLLGPRGPAAEERPIARVRTHSDTYQTHSSSTESLDSMDADSLSDDEEYQLYERMALEELERRKGGPLLSSNPRMRREVVGANHSASSDDADCSVPRAASDADVTSSTNVSSSADVNRSANATNRTSSANAANSANVSSSANVTSSANVSSSADVAPGPADDTYRRKRDRNNHAAKLSRDKRRLRETTMKIREAFLKMKLREDMQLYRTVQRQRSLRFEL